MRKGESIPESKDYGQKGISRSEKFRNFLKLFLKYSIYSKSQQC